MVHKKGSGNQKGDRVGGYATEYKGHAAPELAQKELENSLQGTWVFVASVDALVAIIDAVQTARHGYPPYGVQVTHGTC